RRSRAILSIRYPSRAARNTSHSNAGSSRRLQATRNSLLSIDSRVTHEARVAQVGAYSLRRSELIAHDPAHSGRWCSPLRAHILRPLSGSARRATMLGWKLAAMGLCSATLLGCVSTPPQPEAA